MKTLFIILAGLIFVSCSSTKNQETPQAEKNEPPVQPVVATTDDEEYSRST